MSQLQQFSISRKMKKTAGPAKAPLMTARINLSLSVTLISVLVMMTYINARWWQLFPEPRCFWLHSLPLLLWSLVSTTIRSLTCAVEMRGINYISISNKWFKNIFQWSHISSAASVGKTRKHVLVDMAWILKKNLMQYFLFPDCISESETPNLGLSSQVSHMTGSSFQLYFSHLLLFKMQH